MFCTAPPAAPRGQTPCSLHSSPLLVTSSMDDGHSCVVHCTCMWRGLGEGSRAEQNMWGRTLCMAPLLTRTGLAYNANKGMFLKEFVRVRDVGNDEKVPNSFGCISKEVPPGGGTLKFVQRKER
eukprot:1161083-Pelagomonas_calceolata.AAC.2